MFSLFRRRRAIIVGSTLALFLIAVLVCVFSERSYEVTGQLEVQKESVDGLGLSSMMGDAAGATDALDANITIQTEATILQSNTLALRVIKDLNLESTADFQPHFKAVGWILGLISPAGVKDPANLLKIRRRAVRMLCSSSSTISRSRLCQVLVSSRSPTPIPTRKLPRPWSTA
jgi:uncharacterized protein involved in exopolysaccharide biosynthesis